MFGIHLNRYKNVQLEEREVVACPIGPPMTSPAMSFTVLDRILRWNTPQIKIERIWLPNHRLVSIALVGTFCIARLVLYLNMALLQDLSRATTCRLM